MKVDKANEESIEEAKVEKIYDLEALENLCNEQEEAIIYW